MQRARQQAESYMRLLPDGEGRPPLVLGVDVGHALEIYAEFTRTGGVYRPFPDVRSYRVTIEDLRRPEVRARLRTVRPRRAVGIAVASATARSTMKPRKSTSTCSNRQKL